MLGRYLDLISEIAVFMESTALEYYILLFLPGMDVVADTPNGTPLDRRLKLFLKGLMVVKQFCMLIENHARKDVEKTLGLGHVI
jgi:hypothetical protein